MNDDLISLLFDPSQFSKKKSKMLELDGWSLQFLKFPSNTLPVKVVIIQEQNLILK